MDFEVLSLRSFLRNQQFLLAVVLIPNIISMDIFSTYLLYLIFSGSEILDRCQFCLEARYGSFSKISKKRAQRYLEI